MDPGLWPGVPFTLRHVVERDNEIVSVRYIHHDSAVKVAVFGDGKLGTVP